VDRLLVLSPYPPLPSRGGGGTSYYYYLQALSRAFEVDLVCIDDGRGFGPSEEQEVGMGCSRVIRIIVPRVTALSNLMWTLPTLSPLRLAVARSAGLRHLVRALSRERDYSCVLASHERMGQYLEQATAPARILDLHDVVSHRHRLMAKSEPNPALRLAHFAEFMRMRRFEAHRPAAVTQTWVCTPAELKRLRESGCRGDAVVARKGISVADFDGPPQGRTPRTLLFTGQMSYAPNSDGARFFLDEVLPLVRRRHPDVRCCFAGASPPSWLTRRAAVDRRITVTGRVDSIVPYLRDAAVFVCPLRIGTGVRIKLLEAMAAHSPVVSTTVGYLGIELVPGRHLRVADTPAEFASAVVDLLDRPGEAAGMADEAYRFVRQYYDLPVISGQVVTLVMGHIAAQRGTRS
jgi:glycosyltransferase involved in cell wall biosynthesis